MPSEFRDLEDEARVFLRLGIGKRLRREKGIVLCAEQKSRHSDGVEKLACAALFPIVFRAQKTVDRGGEAVVEMLETVQARQAIEADQPGHCSFLGPHFFAQA